MQPREPSQPWPPGNAPTPAWTKTIDGTAYTVKRIQPDLFGIWRDVEELGIFQLDPDTPDGFHSANPTDLTLEARAVVKEFIETSRNHPDGQATR
jgi:hypothetical protein